MMTALLAVENIRSGRTVYHQAGAARQELVRVRRNCSAAADRPRSVRTSAT